MNITNKTIMLTAVIVAFVILASVVSNTANAQNSSSSGSANGAGKPAPQTNKTLVLVAPGAAGKAGNKTSNNQAGINKTTSSTPGSTNRTGFANQYVLTSPTGKTFPIKYSIVGGKLVGMLADKDRTTLVMVLDPSQKGGNMTIELPRNVIDSKGASNADTKFQIKIDGKGVDYKELANNANGRILAIDFSKDNRFIEIIGTQMKP